MDTCRLVAPKRSNKRTKDTEGDKLNANIVKPLLILSLVFIRFSCIIDVVFIALVLPQSNTNN